MERQEKGRCECKYVEELPSGVRQGLFGAPGRERGRKWPGDLSFSFQVEGLGSW